MSFYDWTLCARCGKRIAIEPGGCLLRFCDNCEFIDHTRCRLCASEDVTPLTRDGSKCNHCYNVYFIPRLMQYGEQEPINFCEIFEEEN